MHCRCGQFLFRLLRQRRPASVRRGVECHAADTSHVHFILFAISVEQAGVELADEFSRLGVPMFDAPLQVSGNEAPAIRMKGDVIYVTVMRQLQQRLLLSISVPDEHLGIIAPAGDELAIRADRYGANGTTMGIERRERLGLVCDIRPDDTAAHIVAGHQAIPVGEQRNRSNPASMARQLNSRVGGGAVELVVSWASFLDLMVARE